MTSESSKQNTKEISSAKFNWYPGHIAKAERELKEKIQLIDIVIELRDARIPLSSHHKDLSQWVKNKPIITVLNKSDLADEKKLNEFLKSFQPTNNSQEKTKSQNPTTNKAVLINAQKGEIKKLISEIESLAKPIIEKNKSKGLRNRPVRIMVVGYPNVGKSSLINKLSRSKKAKVENRPGVTKQQQWIKINPEIHLLDTPGIIPSKLYSEEQALKLALCNCLGQNAFDDFLIACDAIELISKLYPNSIEDFYKLNENYPSSSEPDTEARKLSTEETANSDLKINHKNSEKTLEEIAIARKWFRKASEPDIEKAATKFLFDLKEGLIAKFYFD